MTASMLRLHLLAQNISEEHVATIVAQRFPQSAELPTLVVVKTDTKH